MAQKKRKTRGRGAAGTRREFMLLAVAVAFVAISIGGFFYLQLATLRYQNWLSLSHQISDDVGDLGKAGRDAGKGVEPDFAAFNGLSVTLDDNVKALREGNPDTRIKPLPAGLQDELDAVTDAWQAMKKGIGVVLSNEKAYRDVSANIKQVTETADSMLQQPLAPAQVLLLERIRIAAAQVLSTGHDAESTAQKLQQLGQDLSRAIGAGALVIAFEPAQIAIEAIVTDAPAIGQLQQSAASLQRESLNVIAASKALEQAILDAVAPEQKLLPVVVYSSGGLAVLALIGFITVFLYTARHRLDDAITKDTRQQQAILELLDEITNLADGDLTVDVTVTEDFTGAIADSINYTVASMRTLVGTINSTAGQVASAASGTQETARKMSAASERQAKEITSVTNAIVASSQQLQQVASRAEKLAQEAQRSVQVAHNGADTVGRTIQGMSALREQIQDTSKRIKRLGESSQEIGNIIEFINDISEQTNTLALNASIQAAMAGEAGRGFAVVADEVQRLAERAGNATKQIENLVKTIQADTNEAIVSMERSTTNVVAGAKSAEEAGQALTQIESSSQELAKLIQEISGAARSQSAGATKIAGTMQVIRDIAVQTSGSAARTAQAVGELNALSTKLRESVAGFKLPQGAAA